jgi:DNA-binding MarR family transcriptional regulator
MLIVSLISEISASFILAAKIKSSYRKSEKLSIGPKKYRAKNLEELAREFRQLHGLSASFFRAAAARTGKTVTDMQVIEILDMTGPTTAGRLAELTGLTTGATTGLLNRLEEAGLVSRERDPEDGRKVIVQLERGKDDTREISAIFDPLWKSWEEMAAGYSDEQISLLLEFLERSNAISRMEILRLQEATPGDGKVYSAPLGDLQSARLGVSSGMSMVTLRTDKGMTDLYRARFEGPVPDVAAKDGLVTIRYPRRLWGLGMPKRKAEVALSTAIPWQIIIRGGSSVLTANLRDLKLAGLEVKGGTSMIDVYLPTPMAPVPIKISGASSEIEVRHPVGVPVRVHLKGWSSMLEFEDQPLTDLGNDVRVQSPGYQPDTPGYYIEVQSSTSMVRVRSEK